MIFWYSGTGNSKYAAKEIARLTGDEHILSIPASLSVGNSETIDVDWLNDDSVGVVFPIYAWGVPPIVLHWIDTLDSTLFEHKYVYAICTCGDEAGMAMEMFKKAMRRKDIAVDAMFSVIMPNDYVLLPGFNVDPKELEQSKLKNSEERLKSVAEQIRRKEEICDVFLGPLPRLKTSLVYPLFKSMGIQSRKWKVSDKCIGCKKCERICPVGNISMSDNAKPVWGRHCLSCTACYHVCPVNAVSYGRATKGKGQYICPLD